MLISLNLDLILKKLNEYNKQRIIFNADNISLKNEINELIQTAKELFNEKLIKLTE